MANPPRKVKHRLSVSSPPRPPPPQRIRLEPWRRRRRKRRPRRPGARRSIRLCKEEAVYKDIIAKVQVQLADTSNLYSQGRAATEAFQEENKQKLAETQGKIAALEDEGRRNGYR